jgi:hypothetical protein
MVLALVSQRGSVYLSTQSVGRRFRAEGETKAGQELDPHLGLGSLPGKYRRSVMLSQLTVDFLESVLIAVAGYLSQGAAAVVMTTIVAVVASAPPEPGPESELDLTATETVGVTKVETKTETEEAEVVVETMVPVQVCAE